MTAELYLSQAADLRPHFTIPAIARGIGHPDEIAAGLARAAALALEEEAAKSHVPDPMVTLDASMLLPGAAAPRFGGGRMTLPMRVVLAGLTSGMPRRTVGELEEVALQACKRWIGDHLRDADPERSLSLELHLRDPGSVRSRSIAVARCPISASEYLAGECVKHALSGEFRRRFPEIGEDVEASALAIGSTLRVQAAIAFVDRLVHTERSYFARKTEIERALAEKLRELPTDFDRIDVEVNPDDRAGEAEAGIFVTVLGTSADGRRPGRAEQAPDGERTSAHADSFARAIIARVRGVRAAVVRLEEDDRGDIRHAFVRVELEPGTALESVRPAIYEIVPLEERRSRKIDPGAIG
ncbi:MAG TPA: methionine adenosyltransferase [Planctomycetota bacterium]|nr:methionine adenosyltransferase [Planctomycetota bacterium]